MRKIHTLIKTHLWHCIMLVIAFAFTFGAPIVAYANTSWYPTMDAVEKNTDTGYQIFIDDWADLLTSSEEEQLKELMAPITAHGHVAFVTISENPTYSTDAYADDYYYDHFGYESGTVLIIDMEKRYIQIHSNGEIYRTVTTAYANTITDNCYSYASRGEYYKCAATVFEQIYSLLEGKAIAQPMKYISNALLAIVLALLVNYFLVMFLSRGKKPSNAQLLDGIYTKVEVHNPRINLTNQTRHYSPQNTGGGHGGHGGGHGGGGHGGGHGGGGGSRGGGGGHRF